MSMLHIRTSAREFIDARGKLRDAVRAGRTVWAAGAFDALSAKLIEAAGFDAVFTSGLCVSAAQLGLPDTEFYSMTENLEVVRRVAAAVRVPTIADGDTGYGNAVNVMRTVAEFEAAGAAGIVFEDQASPKRCPACAGDMQLLPIEEAAGKIRAAVASRSDPSMLIVARTDAIDAVEAVARAKAYVAAGADLVQPITRTFKDATGLHELRREVGVPLSLQLVGWMEQGLSREEILELGGLAIYTVVPLMSAVQAMRDNLEALATRRGPVQLPRARASHLEVSEFLGFHAVEAMHEQYLPATSNNRKG
jgi:2-methylisocitrate lyase-like PEP mutase family enzyme